MPENSHNKPDARLYQKIIDTYMECNSVSLTAKKTQVSEVRVRKVLLTEELWSSRTSVMVKHYLEEGRTSEETARILNTTVKAVQQYMPYSKGMYGQENRSASAEYSADYRNRIRTVKEHVLRRNQEVLEKEGWTATARSQDSKEDVMVLNFPTNNSSNDLSNNLSDHPSNDSGTAFPLFEQYPGIVCLRELPEEFMPKRYRTTGADVVRLHLELLRDSIEPGDITDDGYTRKIRKYDEDEEVTRVLKSYGEVKYGETITRDILIPSDLPLYALHYVIQAAFGWQNSHLHWFELPFKKFLKITDNREDRWEKLVGVLLRSPWMDQEDAFWADDYEDGSFKTWLRKKYTGPYLSLCHGEGIIQCKKDIKKIHKNISRVKVDYTNYEGRTFPLSVDYLEEGLPTGEVTLTEAQRESLWGQHIEKRIIKKFRDCTAEELWRFFAEENPNQVLERLPIEEVLALHGRHLEDALEDELYGDFESFMDEDLLYDIKEIVRSGEDDPEIQPMIGAPTDVLYYTYDFGDDWQIRITGSMDACDLIEQGRVTQEDLDKAISKVYETYRPVCIAADGLPLVDDVGGISGYIRFLRAIHPTEEKEYWGKENVPDNWSFESKAESLAWARSLGWKSKVSIGTLL